MKIFIMRHGEAEVIASSDESRHLNDYGRKQSTSQVQWLKTHLNSTALSVQKVIVSPYIRAQETLDLVNSALGNVLNNVEVILTGSITGMILSLNLLFPINSLNASNSYCLPLK